MPRASYTDGTAANNTTYYYVIQGANNGGSSANSSEVSATPGGTSGLLGWWKFDENTGTSVSDSSGYSNTGTFSNGAWATGRSGYAGSFNGTSSAVNMGKGLIATANSFSVSCWVKMSTTSPYQTFVSQDGTNVSGFYLVKRANAGTFGFIFRASDSTGAATVAANATTTPTTGVWYHLIGVYDRPNSQLKLYINGTLEGTASFTTPWSATGVTAIGRSFTGGTPTDWVNGLVDGVRLYNRLLTASEIATISAYPIGVSASASGTTATVSWSAFTNATSYNLYRSTTAGTEGGTPYRTGLTGTSYSDTSLSAGTNYYYKLSAVTADGESAHSDEAAAVNAVPAAPTSLMAVPGNGSAALSWTASTGGGTLTYTVLRSTTNGSGYAAVSGGSGLSGTTFTDSTASNTTTYYYVVQASNNGGTSGNSNQATVTPNPPTLLLVTRITAINGVPVTGFVTDGSGRDTNAYWPSPSSTYLRGGITSTAKPGDTVEYTGYFLVTGSGSITSLQAAAALPAHTTFAAAAYNSLTPTDGGSGNSGLALAWSASGYPTAPTVYLSNAADSDRGTLYAAGTAVGSITAVQNVNGAIVITVAASPTTVPAATSAAAPYNAYGFIRFQVTIN